MPGVHWRYGEVSAPIRPFCSGKGFCEPLGVGSSDVALTPRRRGHRRESRPSGGPAAGGVRGLYLGIVTFGLIFIGLHLSRIFPEIAGPGGLGRKPPRMELCLWKEKEPIAGFSRDAGSDLTSIRIRRPICFCWLLSS